MSRMTREKVYALLLVATLLFFMQKVNPRAVAQTTDEIKIFGLVDKPLNISYSELFSLPTVSEIANLLCVWYYAGATNVTLNWTGIPLFHLLTLAQVRPEAKEVVFRAPDGFSSSLPIEDALKPTVILALEANGTLLTEISKIVNNMRPDGFRIVVPCKWGYKWVGNVNELEVVDYDYKGTYESHPELFSDEADVPNCTQPSITPPLQEFNLAFGQRNLQVQAFTNITISAFDFNYLQKEISLNITIPAETTGFADLIIPNSLLQGPFSVLLDESPINHIEANITNLSYLYMAFPEGTHTARVIGTEFFGEVPEIVVDYNSTAYVGETVVFNASNSSDDQQIVSYEWDFGDNTSGTGLVVNHSYSKEGTYKVKLNVTDNDSLSNSAILTVNVIKPLKYIPTFTKVVLASTLGLLVVLFAILLLQRKPKAGE
jgi:hypothetical protein